ncbi:MAG: hypothetical protein M1166_02530 [Candidatus Thermoplasmatota archaeon]|nr:hypothetical protein [Candidatus Thermoplasmatota archaeon]
MSKNIRDMVKSDMKRLSKLPPKYKPGDTAVVKVWKVKLFDPFTTMNERDIVFGISADVYEHFVKKGINVPEYYKYWFQQMIDNGEDPWRKK